MNRFLLSITAAVLSVTMAGCASDYEHRDAATGAGIGAVLGGVLGKQVSRADGSPYVGAVVGALAGAAVGRYMDNQREELKQKLAEEERRKQLSVSEMSDGSLKVGVASDVTFDTGSAQLKPEAMASLAKLAATLQSYDKTVIHVVGHTDSVGTPEYNQSLSERRAASVADFMVRQGVPAQRIRQEGRGERELLIKTGPGVAEPRNRRVDVVIKPVIEGNEAAAWAPPGYLGG